MLKAIVIIQLIAGILLLSGSLIPIARMMICIGSGSLRRWWAILGCLVLLFMVGYAAFGWLRLGEEAQVADVVASLILFLGSCFVMGVSVLSCLSAKNLVRLATLEKDVVLDPLTGLYNRRYLDARLSEEIRRAERYDVQFSILLLDIDHFKKVNDTFGHIVGDDVIRRVADIVSEVTRPSDTVSRFGGEELLVIAFEIDPTSSWYLAERIRTAIADDLIKSSSGTTVRVTASIGISSFIAGDSAKTVIERADQALYEAKNSGRNRVSNGGTSLVPTLTELTSNHVELTCH